MSCRFSVVGSRKAPLRRASARHTSPHGRLVVDYRRRLALRLPPRPSRRLLRLRRHRGGPRMLGQVAHGRDARGGAVGRGGARRGRRPVRRAARRVRGVVARRRRRRRGEARGVGRAARARRAQDVRAAPARARRVHDGGRVPAPRVDPKGHRGRAAEGGAREQAGGREGGRRAGARARGDGVQPRVVGKRRRVRGARGGDGAGAPRPAGGGVRGVRVGAAAADHRRAEGVEGDARAQEDPGAREGAQSSPRNSAAPFGRTIRRNYSDARLNPPR